MGYVYLINELGSDNYKIGVTRSNDITKRKKKLQTGNANELNIVNEFETKHPFKLEKLLHLYYYKGHIINEWFYLNKDQVKNFIQICKNYNKTIEYLIESGNPFY